MMAEGKIIDVAVKKTSHSPSRFRTFMSESIARFKFKNNIGEGMKMFRKFLTFCLMTVLANVLNDLSFLLPHQLFYLQPSFCI
jgi:hypothetical protein